jgi:GDPmannose 4,6-dehydratase
LPKALITGIDGQDGSYLAELLLSKGYHVAGISRDGVSLTNIEKIVDRIDLANIELTDPDGLHRMIGEFRPSEIYHLAAPSVVSVAPDDERMVLDAIVLGTHALLSGLRRHVPDARFFLAGSSEMFGDVSAAPQDEVTPFCPRAFYGAAKLAAHDVLRFYRAHHGVFACTGLMYNHESPRRGGAFVTRKIARAAARISRGIDQELRLGNLDAQRDWGYAPDYVDAMRRMLAHDTPSDYVVATGHLHTVREFADAAFSHVGLESDAFIVIDPAFARASEATPLVGNPAKLKAATGWSASKPFPEIVREMVDAELAIIDSTL